MIYIKQVLTILIITSCSILWAQEDVLSDETESYGRVYMAEVGIGVFRPYGAFEKNIRGNKFYIESSFLAQLIPGEPFFGGITLNGSSFSNFSAEVNRQTNFGYERWDATTSSKIFGIGLMARFFPPFQPLGIQPYVDFTFGSNILYTYTKYTYAESEETTTIFDETDGTWSYGVGFGFNYPLKNNLYIKTKIGYRAGLSARYYVKEFDSVDQYAESTLEVFELKQSATDAFIWDLGVTFTF